MFQVKIKLILSLILVFGIGIFGFFSYLKKDLSQEIYKMRKDSLNRLILLHPGRLSRDQIDMLEKQGVRVTLFDFQGRIFYDSRNQMEENLLYKEETRTGSAIREEEKSGEVHIYVVQRKKKHYLRLGLREDGSFLKPLYNQFYKYLFFGIVTLGLISLLFMDNILGPIKSILRFTEEFGKGNYESRINYFGGGDIELISKSLNWMARMIDENYRENLRRQALIETVILNLPLGLALLDENGRVEIYNPRLEVLLNTKIKAGKMYYENFFHSKILETIKKCYDEERPVAVKLPVMAMDHKAVYDLNCYDIRGRVILVVNDITEQEKLNRLKQQFISDVTHEFKTPISIIMGYLDILEEKLEKSEEYYFAKIKTAMKRLIEIIDDLIKLEKIEYASLYGDFQEIELEKPLERAIELLSPAAEKKNIQINVEKSSDITKLLGIEEIFYYCFYNLLDNAIKYHDQEAGIIRVQFSEDPDSVKIDICDDGPGIPNQYREDIFRRFYRLSKGRSNGGGSGLGLSIVREGVRFHHGKVYCRDNPEGRGTCFEMIFPRRG